MTENFKKAWAEIERELGHCCLHKKAAFCELAGLPMSRLALAITQPMEKIEAYAKGKNVERRGNRFIFTLNGVKIEITSYPDAKNLDELVKRAFCHTLSIDCVGVQSNGMIIDPYGGLADIRNKVIRLTTPDAAMSELIFSRIMRLSADEGFTVDAAVIKRFEQEQYIQKESYRKKFCELFASVIIREKNWCKAAALLGVLGASLSRRRNLIEYTQKQQNETKDDRHIKAYLYFVFAWLKATGKEIAPVLGNDPMTGYFDSVCANFQQSFHSADAFFALKDKYGDEFAEFLFDVQEVYAVMEKQTYKRPSERNFDLMYRLMCEESRWTSGEERDISGIAAANDESRQKKLEGTFVFEKALNNNFSEENYDEEPTEGQSEDVYVYEEEKNDDTESVPELVPVQKKEICIDDDVDEISDESTFKAEDLAKYGDVKRDEGGTYQEKRESTAPVPSKHGPMVDGVYNHSRGHGSTVLENGGL